jgi:hypothetical protein
MNENSFGGLQDLLPLKSFYDPLRLCRISGRVLYQPGFFLPRRQQASNVIIL